MIELCGAVVMIQIVVGIFVTQVNIVVKTHQLNSCDLGIFLYINDTLKIPLDSLSSSLSSSLCS